MANSNKRLIASNTDDKHLFASVVNEGFRSACTADIILRDRVKDPNDKLADDFWSLIQNTSEDHFKEKLSQDMQMREEIAELRHQNNILRKRLKRYEDSAREGCSDDLMIFKEPIVEEVE